MKKRKKKPPFVPRIVNGTPVCVKCGTKVFLMTGEKKFKCVLCRDERLDRGREE